MTYATRQSSAVRTAKQAAIETTIGASPKLYLYDDAPSAAMTDADPGNAIANGTLPADWATQAAGVLSKSGTWTLTGTNPGGYAKSFRLKDGAGTVNHWDGLVSEPWAGGKTYSVGMQVHNGGNVYGCTTAGTAAATGGPTGTGTGITDGTAVWAYLGAQAMTIDNSNIANGQQITVNTFTNTDGNA